MRIRTLVWTLSVMVFLMAAAVSCTCEGEPEEATGDTGQLPLLDDDTTVATDDTGDDDTAGTTTTVTTTSSTTTTTIPLLRCTLTDDPGSILPNLVGGGAIESTITVYVFDDLTCEPIEGASVYLNGVDPVLTDATGLATLTLPDTKAAQTVTAAKFDGLADGDQDYFSWTYNADAKYMYFRLQPYLTGDSFTDSDEGSFTSGGSPLALTNPDLASLFTAPVYLGIALPKFSRDALFSDLFGTVEEHHWATYENILTEATFDFTIDLGTELNYYATANIFLPELDLTLGDYGITAEHEAIQVPVRTGATVSPIEGAIAGLSLSEAIPDAATLLDLLDCLADASNLMDCLGELVVPFINDALAISHVGANVDWDGTGASNIEMTQAAAKGSFDLTVENRGEEDFVALAWAEITNRALLPLSLGVFEDDTLSMDYIEMAQANEYMIMAGLTDLIASEGADFNFSFAAVHAKTVPGFSGGVTFDADTDFLPLFDTAATSYDSDTGTVSWGLEDGSDTVDAYLVVITTISQTPDMLALLPGTATSYTPPEDIWETTPQADDIVFVMGFDFPDGETVDLNTFDPTLILTHNCRKVNFWSNIDVMAWLSEMIE